MDVIAILKTWIPEFIIRAVDTYMGIAGYRKLKWVNFDFRCHRVDGIACIEYYENGKLKCVAWCKNGLLHRNKGIALITYYDNGKIKMLQRRVEGWLHSSEEPSFVLFSFCGVIDQEQWHWGSNHDPIWHDMMLYTYENNGFGNLSCIFSAGLHRKNNPAFIKYNKDGTFNQKLWVENGKFVKSWRC